ncbi:MAG: DegT/DnrJ/EryC1/StrS family aminotransferase [Planctomycetota bacterium]
MTAGFAAHLLPGKGARAVEDLRAALSGLRKGWAPHLVCAGRTAMARGLQALGLKGKPVAVPAYACPAVWTGVEAAGCTVVRVDVQPRSFGYDLDALRGLVESGAVAGIVATATYGADQDLASLRSLGVPLLDDAAYRATDALPIPGTRGDAGLWSFRFKALCGVAGGVLWLPDDVEIAMPGPGPLPGEWKRFLNYSGRSLSRHGTPKHMGGAAEPQRGVPTRIRAVHKVFRDAPMSGLQAAVVREQWHRRGELGERSSSNRKRILAAAGRRGDLQLPEGEGTVYPHVLPLMHTADADAVEDQVYNLRLALHAGGVQTEDPYPVGREGDEEFPNATDLAKRLVIVPCGAGLKTAEAERVARALTGGR